MRRVAGLAFGLLVLGGCVAPREAPAPPPPPQAPRPAPQPLPAPAPADWRDRPYTPGDWSFSREAGTSRARYGPLTLTCDGRLNQVALSWSGAPAQSLTIRTSYGDSARAALANADGVQLALAATDPLLDQIAFSRGRFMLQAGAQELILPAWPEISRVVEDCR